MTLTTDKNKNNSNNKNSSSNGEKRKFGSIDRKMKREYVNTGRTTMNRKRDEQREREKRIHNY
jgi:hypothetical protein